MPNLNKVRSVISILILPLAILFCIGTYHSVKGGYSNPLMSILDTTLPFITIYLIVSAVAIIVLNHKLRDRNNTITNIAVVIVILALLLGLTSLVVGAIAFSKLGS